MAKKGGNPQNLIPHQFKAGSKKAREAGSKGGKGRQAQIKREKQMGTLALKIAESPVPEQAAKDIIRMFPSLETEEELITNAAIVANNARLAAYGSGNTAVEASKFFKELQEEGRASQDNPNATFTLDPTMLTKDFIEPYRVAREALEGDLAEDETRVREIISKGGRATVKSSFWASFAYETMMRDNKAHVVFTRRHKTDLRKSVYAAFQRAIMRNGNVSEWSFSVSPMRITYKPTGQMAIFEGCENELSVKSIELPFGYIKLWIAEECDEMGGVEQLNSAEISFLRKDTNALSIKIFNPPKSAQNFMNKYTESKLNDPATYICHSYYYNVPKTWIGKRLFELAEWYEEHKPEYYRWAFLGEVTGSGGELFSNVTQRRIKKAEIHDVPIYQGVDWGFEHPSVFIRVAYDRNADTIYIIKEHYRKRVKVKTFLKVVDQYKSQETIADRDPEKIEQAKAFGWSMVGAQKKWKGGGRDYAWEWLRSVREIVVDPALTPHIAEELRILEFEKLRDGTYSSRYPDLGEDGIMAMAYALNRVIMDAHNALGYEDYDDDDYDEIEDLEE